MTDVKTYLEPAEEKMEMAKKMKLMGMPIEAISQISGLTAEQIEQL